jgi:hypothetical protein
MYGGRKLAMQANNGSNMRLANLAPLVVKGAVARNRPTHSSRDPTPLDFVSRSGAPFQERHSQWIAFLIGRPFTARAMKAKGLLPRLGLIVIVDIAASK